MRTTIIATSIFAATIGLSTAASAQAVPGSDFSRTQANEASRAAVAAGGVYGGSTSDATAYGYSANQRVPGSDYERTRANESAREAVRAHDYRGSAGSVDGASRTRIPGSDYGRTIRNQETRDAVR
ncbi:hypothetical protein ATO4_13949 [Aurantimonas sp. 22II-16-19i]|nr:hypothetical protein ATO4_13949 [Aurantimonas sp. 22II-16-19i]